MMWWRGIVMRTKPRSKGGELYNDDNDDQQDTISKQGDRLTQLMDIN